MSKPAFYIVELIDRCNNIEEYITKEEINGIEENPKLGIIFQKIKIKTSDTIIICNVKKESEIYIRLKQTFKYVLSRKKFFHKMELSALIKKIENEKTSEIEIIRGYGILELNPYKLAVGRDSIKSSSKENEFETLMLVNESVVDGFYTKEIWGEYDIMKNEFYLQKIPMKIYKKAGLIEIRKFVKNENLEGYDNALKSFKEKKNIFIWEE